MTRPLIWVGLLTLVCAVFTARQASAATAEAASPPTEAADGTTSAAEPTSTAAELALQKAARKHYGPESEDRDEGLGIFDNLDSIEYLLTEDPDFVYYRDGTRNPWSSPGGASRSSESTAWPKPSICWTRARSIVPRPF